MGGVQPPKVTLEKLWGINTVAAAGIEASIFGSGTVCGCPTGTVPGSTATSSPASNPEPWSQADFFYMAAAKLRTAMTEYFQKSTKSATRWAVAITLFVIFVPPIVITWLPVWADVNYLVAHDSKLTHGCEGETKIILSRWFYTYKISGEYEYASFRGRVKGAGCERHFRIEVNRSGQNWHISRLSFD